MTSRRQKPPTSYVEWRALWHQELASLGWMAMHSFDGEQLHMTRELYRKLRQVRRIYDRLELEEGVKDKTWVQAFFEMMHNWEEKDHP